MATGHGAVVDRLLVDISADGLVSVSVRLADDEPNTVVERSTAEWPLDAAALEDLRWYLEEYLRYPFAVYSDRGAEIAAKFEGWGEALFQAVFGSPDVRAAYATVRARGNRVEVVFQSESAQRLGLPWELMRDPSRGRPLALDGVAVTRHLPVRDLSVAFPSSGDRLRVLMVICRPNGDRDVGYQMIARPLLERLDAVRGNVDLVVLRPPTLDHLREVLAEESFQVVHFDGHGVFGDGRQPAAGWDPFTYTGPAPRGMLAFEKPGGGPDLVPAEDVAQVLSAGRVPVVVLNACQSGQVGAQVEAAVATRLVQDGAASVVAMAYSVYAVAAAEFMAAFYERLFAGDRVADAVTAGRERLSLRNERPSPKGKLPLADWVVPVHYRRRDVRFPYLRTERTAPLSLNEMLDRRPEPDERGEELAPVGKFVGRDGLFYTLESAARLQRVVVLHGPGGTGKSELAKAFGRWWRDTAGVDRPDFVVWHSFEPGLASFGLDGVVNEIGLRVYGTEFSLADRDERRRVVRELLRDHRLLLIWDNFETVHTLPDPTGATPVLDEADREELKDFLTRIARSGRSSVLITSRAPEDWLGDVRRVEVGGLDRDEAIDYADQLLEPFPRALPRRQGTAFAELMEWLDGHPLSMRLILPLLETTDPDTLLSGLRGVTPLPGRDDADRTGSLSAGIAYSFTHLVEDDQQALTALALFQGTTDTQVLGLMSDQPEVPAQFAGRTGDSWARLLDAAADVGLLTRLGGSGYRIHPALPAYLTARWRTDHPATFAEEHAVATHALLTAYTALGRWLYQALTGEHARIAVAVLGVQRRNLGNMLGYALDRGWWARAQELVQPLSTYWNLRGLSAEARGWSDRGRLALETPDGTPPSVDTPGGRLWIFFRVGEANREFSALRLDQAQGIYLTILDVLQGQAQTAEQQSYVAGIYQQLGAVAQEWARWDEAEEWYRRSLTIVEDQGHRSRMASVYHQLGIVEQGRGRWDAAEEWYRRSLTIEEEHGNRAGMAITFHQLGIVAQERSRWDEAEEWYRRSLTIKEGLGDRPGAAITGHQLGIVAQERGQWDEAEEWYHRSLIVKEELGNRPGMALTYGQLGLLAEDRTRPMHALDWMVRAIALFEEFPHPATGPGPAHLKRLTERLGVSALEDAWQRVTGRGLPDDIREFVQRSGGGA